MAKKDYKTTEAQRRATAVYQKKFVHSAINFDPEKKRLITEYCARHNTSMTKLVNDYFDKLLAEEASENSAK